MLCSQVMCDGQLALLPVSLLVGALGGAVPPRLGLACGHGNRSCRLYFYRVLP